MLLDTQARGRCPLPCFLCLIALRQGLSLNGALAASKPSDPPISAVTPILGLQEYTAIQLFIWAIGVYSLILPVYTCFVYVYVCAPHEYGTHIHGQWIP